MAFRSPEELIEVSKTAGKPVISTGFAPWAKELFYQIFEPWLREKKEGIDPPLTPEQITKEGAMPEDMRLVRETLQHGVKEHTPQQSGSDYAPDTQDDVDYVFRNIKNDERKKALSSRLMHRARTGN